MSWTRDSRHSDRAAVDLMPWTRGADLGGVEVAGARSELGGREVPVRDLRGVEKPMGEG